MIARSLLVATLALAAAALAACRERPPSIDSCAGPLGGVWRDTGGRGYHILDRGREVEIFPMWDTTAPKPPLVEGVVPTEDVRSPLRIVLGNRTPAGLTGTTSVRITRGAKTCTFTAPATLAACRGRSADLALATKITVDPATCASTDGPSITVPLRRE